MPRVSAYTVTRDDVSDHLRRWRGRLGAARRKGDGQAAAEASDMVAKLQEFIASNRDAGTLLRLMP